MTEETESKVTRCVKMTVGLTKVMTVGLPAYSSVKYEASIYEAWEVAPEDSEEAALTALRTDRAQQIRAFIREQMPSLKRPPSGEGTVGDAEVEEDAKIVRLFQQDANGG